MISPQKFDELARARGGTRLSICLPTHQRGAEVEGDSIRLKNLVAEAEKRAEEQDVPTKKVRERLEPVRRLIEDDIYWSHQGDGLALYASEEGLQQHRLPVSVDDVVLLGDRFCVRPLVPAVSRGQSFHLLALSQGRVRLLQCSREGAREVDLHDIPKSLAEAVGYDWEERSLQFHTGSAVTGGGGPSAMFHGQGYNSDKDKAEIEKFLHMVDDGVCRLLNDSEAPLLLAGVDYEVSMYRKISDYPRVAEESVHGNPDHLSTEELHRAGMDAIAERLDQPFRKALDELHDVAHTDRAALGIHTVLPAVRDARVGRLLLHAKAPIWGRWNPDEGAVDVHERREAGDDDLLDLAVSLAAGSGAEILPMDGRELPQDAPVAAMLRY